VTDFRLSVTEATIDVGRNVTLRATMTPSNASLRGVSFSSSNDAIARVEPNGRVVGVAGGVVTITAVSDGGALVRTAVITVRVPVTAIALPEASVELRVGETFQITPILTPENATMHGATFATRSRTIASVDENGLVTANRAGSTVITVRLDGQRATLNVTVVN
jgi:uncharacterized protein YjdB